MKKSFLNILFSFLFLFVCFSAEAQKNPIPPKFSTKYQGFLADHLNSLPLSNPSYPSDSLNLNIGIGGESLGFVASSEIMDRQQKIKEAHDPSFIPKEFVSNGRLYPIPFLDQVSLGNFFIQMQTHHHTQDLPFLQSNTHSSLFEILNFRFHSQPPSFTEPVFVKHLSSRVIDVIMDRDRQYVRPIAFVLYEATLTQIQGDRVIEVPLKEIWTLFLTGDKDTPYHNWILAGVTPL